MFSIRVICFFLLFSHVFARTTDCTVRDEIGELRRRLSALKRDIQAAMTSTSSVINSFTEGNRPLKAAHDSIGKYEKWCRDQNFLHPDIEFKAVHPPRGENYKKAKYVISSLLLRGGNGVFTKSNIAPGTLLAEAKIKYCLQVDMISKLNQQWMHALNRDSKFLTFTEGSDGVLAVKAVKSRHTSFAILAIVLLYEQHVQSIDQEYSLGLRDSLIGDDILPYLASFPNANDLDHPTGWPEDLIQSLGNSTIGRLLRNTRKQLSREYTEMVGKKCGLLCEADGPLSQAKFIWARTIVRAYSFSAESEDASFANALVSFKGDESHRDPPHVNKQDVEPMLVPCLDKFNHKPKFASAKFEGRQAIASHSIKSDQEIFFSYGTEDNRVLLVGYGFIDITVKGPTFDFIDVIDLNSILSLLQDETEESRSWKKSHFARILNVDNVYSATLRVEIQTADVPERVENLSSTRAIKCLRIAYLSTEEMSMYDEGDEERVISARNEALVWLTLYQGIQAREEETAGIENNLGLNIENCVAEARLLLQEPITTYVGPRMKQWSRKTLLALAIGEEKLSLANFKERVLRQFRHYEHGLL